MQSLMDIVTSIKVTAEHSPVVIADEGFDDFPSTRMMILVIANGWGARRPDVAILPIFSPPRLIHLQGWTRSDLHFEGIQVRLHLLFEPMEHLHNFSTADGDPVHSEQVRLDLANGQTHEQAQGRNQAS
jgi:hypothetical protein